MMEMTRLGEEPEPADEVEDEEDDEGNVVDATQDEE
jgi:hypothetical protein